MITTVVSQSGFGVQEWTPEEIDAAIYAAEAHMASQPLEDRLAFERFAAPEHVFADKIVGRMIVLPEDSWNTGKLHRHEDLLIIASGTVEFLTKQGTVRRFEGPCMTTVQPNTKPFVHAITEVVMFSAHPNPDNSRDLDEIEDRVIQRNELGVKPAEVLI